MKGHFLAGKTASPEQTAQYNDVVNYINFRLYANPFEDDKKRMKAGLRYAKRKKYDVAYIKKELKKAME